MVDSRRKGAAFEREVANLIQAATGIIPKRNLEQYRAAEQGDLLGVCGWTVECKIRGSGTWVEEKWWRQVDEAAKRAGNRPALVFRLCRQPIRVMIRSHLPGLTLPIRMVIDLQDWIGMIELPSTSTVAGSSESGGL